MTEHPDLFDVVTPDDATAQPGTSSVPTPAAPVEGEGMPAGTGKRRRGMQHATCSTSAHARTIERLEPVALIVGDGRHHFTAFHVRTLAVKAGILTGEEGRPHPDTGRLQEPRALSFLGALLPGLARLGLLEKWTIGGRVQYDESEGERANGNKQVCWILTPDGRALLRNTERDFGSTTLEHVARALDARRAADRDSKQAQRKGKRAEH